MDKLPLTKNRLYNEIMQEIDSMQKNSKDIKDFQFKLAGLYGKVLTIINLKYK
jgi:hypothetical protein